MAKQKHQRTFVCVIAFRHPKRTHICLKNRNLWQINVFFLKFWLQIRPFFPPNTPYMYILLHSESSNATQPKILSFCNFTQKVDLNRYFPPAPMSFYQVCIQKDMYCVLNKRPFIYIYLHLYLNLFSYFLSVLGLFFDKITLINLVI